MIRHIVLFKFKQSTTEQDVQKLEQGLGSLPAIIPEIKFYEFGRDVMHSERSFDFGLVSTFSDINSLRQYVVHPEHQKILKHINAICDSIKSVDFESKD